MIPPSTTPTIGEARAHEGGHGYGLVLFASILLVVIGCFNLIYGIAAIANSHVFVTHAHFVFANLKTWGWITVVIGIIQVVLVLQGLRTEWQYLIAGLIVLGVIALQTQGRRD